MLCWDKISAGFNHLLFPCHWDNTTFTPLPVTPPWRMLVNTSHDMIPQRLIVKSRTKHYITKQFTFVWPGHAFRKLINDDILLFPVHFICQEMYRSQVDSPHKGPVKWSVVASLNNMLNKQSSCTWFETIWRVCDVIVVYLTSVRCMVSGGSDKSKWQVVMPLVSSAEGGYLTYHHTEAETK